MYNILKEDLRKLLEDCWDAGVKRAYVDDFGPVPNKNPDRDTYITSQLSAMEQGGGMRWVKASDRRPDIEGEYYAKDSMGEKCISFFYGGHWKSVTGNPIVEWLSESPSDGQDWISVGNQPEDKWVLLYNGNWIGVGKFNNKEDKERDEPEWQDETSEYISPDPTHWMPLPKPPSQ